MDHQTIPAQKMKVHVHASSKFHIRYIKADAVTDFLEAIGILWVDESLVNRLLDAQYFSLMA